jgi:hypothetical protein
MCANRAPSAHPLFKIANAVPPYLPFYRKTQPMIRSPFTALKNWLYAACALLCLGLPACDANGEFVSRKQEIEAHGPVVISLSTDASKAIVGQTAKLSWTATNATGCLGSAAWTGALPVSGSRRVAVTEAGTNRFVITCFNASAQSVTEVDIEAYPATLELRESFKPRAVTISTSEGAPYGDTDFWPQRDTTVSNFGYGPAKVQRVYICLSGMVGMSDCSAQASPSGPLSAEILSGIDMRLARFAGSGKRLLVRFVYNLGPIGPSARDVPSALILTHIDQLAPVLLKHQDLVFALEAGFLGTWGEWHSSTSGNDNAKIRNNTVARLMGHFGGHFPVLLRYPSHLIDYLDGAAPSPGLGLHDDYFASDSSDGGTWGHHSLFDKSRDTLQRFAAEIASTSMFVGEFGALDPERQSCTELDQYSQRFHPQSIALGIWPTSIGATLSANGCALQFFNKVGTRIELLNGVILGSSSKSETMRLELTFANTGYGRVIRARPVTLVLSRGEHEVARQLIPIDDVDLRKLAPGAESVTFAFDVRIPLDFSATPSSLPLVASLWIPDPAPSLAALPAYALPLNNIDDNGKDIFSARTGQNRIGIIMLQPIGVAGK